MISLSSTVWKTITASLWLLSKWIARRTNGFGGCNTDGIWPGGITWLTRLESDSLFWKLNHQRDNYPN
ncbi:hypothetical protein V6Z12_A13G137900 [Gossypium hirsutum]